MPETIIRLGLNIKTNANSQYVRTYSLGNLIELVGYKKGIVVKEEHHEYSTDEKTSNISIYSDNGDILETYGEKNDEPQLSHILTMNRLK